MSDKGENGNNDAVAKALEQMTKQNEAILGALKKIGDGQSASADVLAGLSKGLTELGKPREPEPEPKKDPLAGRDLETMSRQEFMDAMLGKVGQLMEERAGALDKKVDETGAEARRTAAQAALRVFQKDHPDLMEWEKEMTALAQETGGSLSLDRMYRMVREEADPERRNEVDKKYGLGKFKEEEGGDASSGKEGPKYGGQLPSGKGGEATLTDGKMSPEDAAKSAWDDTMGQLADIPGFGLTGEAA